MDEKIKTRIILFYIGGILNGMFGLYIVFEGPSFLQPDQVQMMSIVFLVFTIINFYMAAFLKKKLQAHIAGAQKAKSDDRSPAS
jgi:hypothetical protein